MKAKLTFKNFTFYLNIYTVNRKYKINNIYKKISILVDINNNIYKFINKTALLDGNPDCKYILRYAHEIDNKKLLQLEYKK